jgi:3-deoxy-D-manno-octulosonic acid kinase
LKVEPRIQETATGALLYDAARRARAEEQWFEHDHWAAADAILQETSGRGSVLVVRHAAETWVLRHYHRGGFVARLVSDHYLWLGLERTRAFREWRLLARLHAAGLPVPDPIAARVVRTGAIYTADIITTYLTETRKLSAFIADGRPPAECWSRIGAMLRDFHDHGVDHPDLTAHNILLDPHGGLFLVDFDNARLRRPGPWARAGVQRFKRSLRKVALETGTDFDEDAWREVEAAYARQP